jgi:hypothetical protein
MPFSNFSIYPLTSEAQSTSFTFFKFPASSISVSVVNFPAQVKLALRTRPQLEFFVSRETCHAKLLLSFIVERHLNVPAHWNFPSS